MKNQNYIKVTDATTGETKDVLVKTCMYSKKYKMHFILGLFDGKTPSVKVISKEGRSEDNQGIDCIDEFKTFYMRSRDLSKEDISFINPSRLPSEYVDYKIPVYEYDGNIFIKSLDGDRIALRDMYPSAFGKGIVRMGLYYQINDENIRNELLKFAKVVKVNQSTLHVNTYGDNIIDRHWAKILRIKPLEQLDTLDEEEDAKVMRVTVTPETLQKVVESSKYTPNKVELVRK